MPTLFAVARFAHRGTNKIVWYTPWCLARQHRLGGTKANHAGLRKARALLSRQDLRHARAQGHAQPAALRVEGSDDARGLRGDDRQRQDGAGNRLAGRGGDRRHPGDRDRSQGRPGQPAPELPRAAAGGFPAVGRSRRGGPARAHASSSSRPRRPSSGARDWPPGVRTARGSRGSATRSTWRSTRRAAPPGCR